MTKADKMTPPEPTDALVVRATEGELIAVGGVEHHFKLTSQHTSGRFGLEQFRVPPHTLGARPHIHYAHDEYFYIIQGSLTVATTQGETELQAGDLAAAPRGALHGFRNTSDDPAIALCLYTPSGYEQYFRDVHAAHQAGVILTDEVLGDFRRKYQTESF
jgi:quercetin dioxygenase-like cupin family protein